MDPEELFVTLLEEQCVKVFTLEVPAVEAARLVGRGARVVRYRPAEEVEALRRKLAASEGEVVRLTAVLGLLSPARVPVPEKKRPIDIHRKLTEAQLKVLRLLRKGRQNTFGSDRARVQNNLYSFGFARFFDIDNKETPLCDSMGLKNLTDGCEITDAGRAALEAYERIHGRDPKKKVRRRPAA